MLSLLNDLKNEMVSKGIITEIYPLRLPQDAPDTAIILSVISDVSNHSLTDTVHQRSRVQVTVVSPYYIICDSVTAQIKAVINHLSPTWADVILHDQTTETYSVDGDGSDNVTYQKNSDFQIIHA